MQHVVQRWVGIFVGLAVLLATNLSLSQSQNTTVSISLSKTAITTGQSTVLTWSSAGATSCQGGGDPYIPGWSNIQQATSGSYTVTQEVPGTYSPGSYKSAGTYVYALTCTGHGSTASASATLTVTDPGSTPKITEAITSLPADIAPMLSVAGIWQPVANQYLRSDCDNGSLANIFPQNIRLANGKEGLVITGWSFCGAFDASGPITPVNIAVLEQQPDGTLQLATSKYVSDPQTNGGNNLLIADFNNDGYEDFFLPAHNESPFLPSSSSAYVSKSDGTYSKISIGDQVEAHAATLAYVNGRPTVFTGGYYANFGKLNIVGHPNVDVWNGSGFTVAAQPIDYTNSSMAVGDFYGDGNYSEVYGDLPYPPGSDYINGIYLYHLSNLMPVGDPLNVGDPYFNDKPQYAQYVSGTDPHGKTHCYRAWLDDFNHDGKLDIVVQGMIWNASEPQLKNMIQMFQNVSSYQFSDVTDKLNSQYDENCQQYEYVPQVRDIDSSGINSYLFGTDGEGDYYTTSAGNYVLLNDGSGNIRVALHETLNTYAKQASAWISSNLSFAGLGPVQQPRLRAYMTPDGKMNFIAIVWMRTNDPQLPRVERYVIVNIPLRLDLPKLFTKPIVVKDRNGSHLIRTFAGDDTIYSGNNGGFSRVDGGLGTNTVVYSGPSQNYSATSNADGTWTIKDKVGNDGTDTLTRIQRLQFTDITATDVFFKPTALTYSTNPATYIKGTAIANNRPSNRGGQIVAYSISPALPAGLFFNTSTGVISGTPTVLSVATNYTVTGTNSGGSTTTTISMAVVAPTQALNISTRMRVDTGSNVLIAGFIITGNANKNLVVRGLGPSLTAFGITDALADPTLELHGSDGSLIVANDNWQDNPAQASQISAVNLAPANPKEPGIFAMLQPGAYTAILAGKDQGTGIGLVEVYDTNGAVDAQLANISTRGLVLTGNNVMIGGFILGGGGAANVLVRAIGPSLIPFGISNALADPTLELHDGNGTMVIANDNWKIDSSTGSSQETAIRATQLQPSNDLEAAILVTLQPGPYTAIVAGKGGATGVGLVEVYNVK